MYAGLETHASPVVHDYQIFRRTIEFESSCPLFYTRMVSEILCGLLTIYHEFLALCMVINPIIVQSNEMDEN